MILCNHCHSQINKIFNYIIIIITIIINILILIRTIRNLSAFLISHYSFGAYKFDVILTVHRR